VLAGCPSVWVISLGLAAYWAARVAPARDTDQRNGSGATQPGLAHQRDDLPAEELEIG
jgi:hypothetical protein